MSIKLASHGHRVGEQALIPLVRELLQAWNAHDIDRAVTYYSADYEGVDVAQAAPQRGPEGIRDMLSLYMRAFPDLHFTEEATIVQGEQVAMFWTAQGTHQGALMNIPPTGRSIQVRGVSLLTLSDGKVARALYIWDVAGLLRGIGLLPEL